MLDPDDPALLRQVAAKLRASASPFPADPLSLVVAGKLQIKTKDGQRLPLVLNACQRKVLDTILTIRAAGRPVRLWMLKFRQGGISTVCEAVLYALTSVQPNRNALVVADEDEKSKYIHEIAKHYHEHMRISDPALTPEIRRSNAKELVFESIASQLMVVTAKNFDAPRAKTYQYVHLSEAAFYDHLDLILQALQGVPDHADTMILVETTANGAGTAAQREWEKAKAGKTEWRALFLPWFLMEEYARPAPEYPLNEITYDREGGQAAFEQEEAGLAERIMRELGCGADAAARKLNWRRWCIVNKCQGRVSVFRVEYPADDEEAWAVSGTPYYPSEYFLKQRLKEPKRIGYLVRGSNGPEIRDLPDGPIHFFEWPNSDDRYLIPSDPSEGIRQDDAASVVRNVRTNANDAELSSLTMDGDRLAEQVYLLSLLYGNVQRSELIPERNGIGAAHISSLRRLTGNIFREHVTETGSQTVEREGWFTDSVSRPLMFDQLGIELRETSVTLAGIRSLTQIRRLINKDGRPEAPPGGQDGLAICNAIASKVRSLRPITLDRPRSGQGYAGGISRVPPPNMGRGYQGAEVG